MNSPPLGTVADFYNDPYTVEGYKGVYLEAPELRILHRVSAQLPRMDMLDIGVGAGRTALFFAPFARGYLGLDIAEEMVNACRVRCAGLGARVRFDVADAADLGALADDAFDFVLFSFNGIDCIHPSRRDACMLGIRRVLRSGGLFVFAAHNLRMIPFYYRYRPQMNGDAWRKERERLRRIRTNGDPAALLAQQQILFWDGEYFHHPDFRHVYIRPEFQVTELKRLGFSEIDVLSLATGQTLSDEEVRTTEEHWLYYWCRSVK